MTPRSVAARARQILRERKELSPEAHDLDPGDIERILRAGVPGAIEYLQQLERLPRVTLYRALAIARGKKLDPTRLGLYWTCSKDAAEPYWGVVRWPTVPVELLLRGTVASRHVDWTTSAALLVLRGMDELEIRLRPGVPVFLETVNDKPYNAWGKA